MSRGCPWPPRYHAIQPRLSFKSNIGTEQRGEKSNAATQQRRDKNRRATPALAAFLATQFLSRTPINNPVVSVVTNMVVIIASLITIAVLAKLTLF